MGSMKACLFITLFLVGGTLNAADKKVAAADATQTGPIAVNDSLQKLMDIDGVKPIYTECEKNYPVTNDPDYNANRTARIFNCLWTEIKTKPDLKKKVIAAYTEEIKSKPDASGNSRAPASTKSDEKTSLTARTLNVGENYEADPAVDALSKFYGDKLNEILDPEKALSKEDNKNGVILSVDHKKFIELYKSELGKTIINAFTSYCYDSDPLDGYKIETAKIKDNRKSNLKSLKSVGTDLSSNSVESRIWIGCIEAIPKKCETNGPQAPLDPQGEETAKRACLIVDYVKAARKNLLIADKQIEAYKELDSGKYTGIVGNTKAADSKKSSTSEILNITSADVEKSLKDTMDKKKQELEKCMTEDQAGNRTIVNAEACKVYLSTNTDANNKALQELGMRQIAQEGILEEQLNSSPDRVRDYLKEEGYSDPQIKTMTADQVSLDKVKSEIMDRFRAQKAAIISEMAKKIESKTSTADAKIDNKDVPKIVAIKDELASRTEDLQNLVQFNNIVSAYLGTQDKATKKTDRNTDSLFAEVNSLTDKNEQELMNKKIQEAKITKKDSPDVINLDVETLNSLMKYSTEPADTTNGTRQPATATGQ
jgi:hypothetical protein